MTKAPIEETPRALVVADQKLANVLALALNHGRYETRCVTTIAQAEQELVAFRPQLLIVSIDLDRERALALVGKRVAGQRIPTIALTKRGGLAVKLAAFERGVDDLMVIPFFPEELVARVIALMRRTYGESVAFIPVIKIAGLEVDLLNQRVRQGAACSPGDGRGFGKPGHPDAAARSIRNPDVDGYGRVPTASGGLEAAHRDDRPGSLRALPGDARARTDPDSRVHAQA